MKDSAAAAPDVAKYLPLPGIHVMLAFLNGVELMFWAVTFGDQLAAAINAGSMDREILALTGGMVFIWVRCRCVSTHTSSAFSFAPASSVR